MRNKFFTALLVTALPTFAFAADIRVINETDIHGTAHFNSFIKICSSTLGDSGVLKPKQKDFYVKGSSIKTACGSKDCEAIVFASSNCDKSTKIATVVVNANSGIVNLNNLAKDRYNIKYSATEVTIANASTGFKAWFKSLF